MKEDFQKELTALINKHSVEQGSNTPDFLLALLVTQTLETFAEITRERERLTDHKRYSQSEITRMQLMWAQQEQKKAEDEMVRWRTRALNDEMRIRDLEEKLYLWIEEVERVDGGVYRDLVEDTRDLLNQYPRARRSKRQHHGLDNEHQVFFYENEFYPLSNFSAFTLDWKDRRFDTSEAAYHWEKFPSREDIRCSIYGARSAHDAFKLAEANKQFCRADWGQVRVSLMKEILRAKVTQHEYVRRKLLETGDRILIENSWRDAFWGWGPDRRGENMLGRLWMEIRAELRAKETPV